MDVWFTQHAGRPEFVQQDSLLNAGEVHQGKDIPVACMSVEPDGLLTAVADGVSGSPAAGRASRLILQILSAAVNERPDSLSQGLLGPRMVSDAAEIFRGRLARGRTWGAATTLAAAQIRGNRAAVVNCGDSRVYLVRRGEDGQPEWRQVTRDHTMLDELRADGSIKAGNTGRYASIYSGLAHCIVADPEESQIRCHSRVVDIQPGDIFLLMTDGVHETLGDERLRGLYGPEVELSVQLGRWRNAVIDAGAPDNLTLVAFRIPGHIGQVP